MNDYKPIYLEFPIFQITYFLFWIPIGYKASYICAFLTINIITAIMNFILSTIYPTALEMFLISGRMNAMLQYMTIPITIAFDILILIVGLEVISYFLNKKRFERGFDEQSNANKN